MPRVTDKKTALLDAWDQIEIAKRRFSIAMRKLLPIGEKVTAALFVKDKNQFEDWPAEVTNHSDGGEVVVRVAIDVAARIGSVNKLTGYDDRVLVNFHQVTFPKPI